MIYKFEFDVKALQIILAGLDKLPGEVSRQLHNGIVQSAQQQEVDATKDETKKEVGEVTPKPKTTKRKTGVRKAK